MSNSRLIYCLVPTEADGASVGFTLSKVFLVGENQLLTFVSR